MAKTQTRGTAGTPGQLRPTSVRTPVTRQATAAQAAKQQERSDTPKRTTGICGEKQKEGDDVATDKQESSATTPTPTLIAIANALAEVIQKCELANEAKKQIGNIIQYARTEAEKETKWAEEPKAKTKVRTIRNAIKQDLLDMYAAIDGQMSAIRKSALEALHNSEKVLKEIEESKDTANDIASKVGKVTEATNKIASKTESYRDAILANPRQHNVVSADPRVLIGMDRKAKQILVDIYDTDC
jgi:hypothetical protein